MMENITSNDNLPDDRVEELDPKVVKQKPLQPDWENAPTVSQLKSDVSDAEPDFQQHVSNVKKWLDLRDARLKVKIGKGKSRVSPKLIRKQNEWRYSSLSEPFLTGEDMFDVNPATFADKESARDNAIIINKQFRQDINTVVFIDEYVRTAVDEGVVFVRVGWEFKELEDKYEEEIVNLTPVTTDPAQWQQMVLAVQQGQLAEEALWVEEPTGKFVEKTEVKTIYNRPTLEVCDYNKVMLDPTCGGDVHKAKFMVYQFYSSKGELNPDEKYSNIDAITMDSDNPMSYSDDDVVNGSFQFKDDTRKRLLVTEYWGEWDIHNNGTTVPIVAAYSGDVMIRLEENPFPDKKPPFVKVVYLPKRRDVYGGEPDAVLIEDNQDVIGAVTRGMIDLMGKSANAQQGISANALDPAQKLRFEQGKDFVFNPDVDPEKAFFMASYPDIPQSAGIMIQSQTADAESLTAIRSFGQGLNSSSLGNVAEGIRTANDASAKRELAILRRLASGVVEIGEKITAMNAENLDDEEVIRITDEEEVTISRDDLAGNYDLVMSISTPEVDQEKAQDLGFMLQTIGPGMDPGLQSTILGEIARLKKMPGLAKQIESYEPKPNPDDEKIKQLQIELLAAQLANEISKGDENQADSRLKNAKAETERAKTRNLDSASDNQDLDFINESSGTKHQREIDKANQSFDHELGKKAADSLLSGDTPTEPLDSIPSLSPINPSSGSLPVDDLDVINTPEQNLSNEISPAQ